MSKRQGMQSPRQQAAQSPRQAIQAQRRRKQLLTTALWAGLALALVVGVGGVVWAAARPLPGEAVAVMADSSHVAEGTDPGPYNSDPPASGKHYEATLKAGFYNEGDVTAEYPAGHLVHNLEHGYVIFWYNCALAGGDCSALKSAIQAVLQAEDNLKVIAYPWSSIDVPVVLTSWGRMQRFAAFDAQQAREFVRRNRNKAPEPNAP